MTKANDNKSERSSKQQTKKVSKESRVQKKRDFSSLRMLKKPTNMKRGCLSSDKDLGDGRLISGHSKLYRTLAKAAGVNRISAISYKKADAILFRFLATVLEDAKHTMTMDKRKTLSDEDVEQALTTMGINLEVVY